MLQFINFLALTGLVVLVLYEYKRHKDGKPVEIQEYGRFGVGHPVIITKGPYFGKTGRIRMIIDKDPTGKNYLLSDDAVDIYVSLESGGIRIINANHLEIN